MKIDVKRVGELANLNLTPEEIKRFEKQLSDILTYIDKLNELDTKDVEPTAQVTGLSNVLREDETTPGLTQEEALSGTENKHDGFFVVKQILEEK